MEVQDETVIDDTVPNHEDNTSVKKNKLAYEVRKSKSLSAICLSIH